MDLFAIVGPTRPRRIARRRGGQRRAAASQINFFWIIVASLNFLVFA